MMTIKVKLPGNPPKKFEETNNSEKVQFLPKNWSTRKVQDEFGAINYTPRCEIKDLRKYYTPRCEIKDPRK